MSLSSRARDRARVDATIGLPERGGPQRFNLRDGQPFAVGYERVVYGDRGPYVEFTREQIVAPLDTRYKGNDLHILPPETSEFYFVWLEPTEDRDVKVYWQIRPVAYADYRRGFYYVAPHELIAVGCTPGGERQRSLFDGEMDPRASVLSMSTEPHQ